MSGEDILEALGVEHNERDVNVVGKDSTTLVDSIVDCEVEFLAFNLLQNVMISEEAVTESERRFVECCHNLPQGGVEESLQRLESADHADVFRRFEVDEPHSGEVDPAMWTVIVVVYQHRHLVAILEQNRGKLLEVEQM